MGKWKCMIGNEFCFNGFHIENGEKKGNCTCVRINATQKSWKWSTAPEKMKLTFSKLEDNNIVELNLDITHSKLEDIEKSVGYVIQRGKLTKTPKEATQKSYKELGKNIIEHLPTLIEKNVKIVVYGNPGCGKSQFVSSLILESALKQGTTGYYLEASRLYDAVFNFSDKSELEEIKEKIKDPITKILVIDDMGSEFAKNDQRVNEMIRVYNNLIRDFQKKDGLIVITSNLSPITLYKAYDQNRRLFDVLFQQGRTKFYEFSAKQKFRQKTEDNDLDFLL